MSKMPAVSYFGDLLLKDNLSDDDIVRSFLIVALVTFICPSSSVAVSPRYLSPLLDMKRAKDWNWSMLIFDWLISMIKKYQSGKAKEDSGKYSSVNLGGCLYFLAVSFLSFFLTCFSFLAFLFSSCCIFVM